MKQGSYVFDESMFFQIIFTADASRGMRRGDENSAGSSGVGAPPRVAQQQQHQKRKIPSERTPARSQVEVVTIDDDDRPTPVKTFSEAPALFPG